MELKELCEKAYENAYKKGFWEDYLTAIDENVTLSPTAREMAKNNAIAARIALITSELSEALSALREGDNEHFEEEVCDVYLRLSDLSRGLNIDIESVIQKKMESNRKRPYKHGKLF